MVFKVGDRVTSKVVGDDRKRDMLGTVLGVNVGYSKTSMLVEFDKDISGHSGDNDEGKDGHCWYCKAYDLILEPRIIAILASVEVEGKLK